MTLLFYLILAALLLLLNAFFVLAEFAAVKMRATRVEELVGQGQSTAKIVQHIQANLDEYLSVCQMGITLASIGLGFVGEPAFAKIIMKLAGTSVTVSHQVALGLAYVLVSGLHIVLGEQVPKMFAIARPEGAALITALPLKVFRAFFALPLVLLKGATSLVLRPFGVRGRVKETEHSEEELRILLAQSQSTGIMSFRRLLFLENIFDLGDVRVRDSMLPREGVKVIRLGAPWEENFKIIRESRFSRYPLVDGDGEMPIGVVHVKDLLYQGPEGMAAADLRKLARPYVTTSEDVLLEDLLSELQRHRGHLAMVRNAAGKWVGFVSLEDVIEEIIGTIEDEFEVEPSLSLADAVTPGRVVLGIRAANLEEAIVRAFAQVPDRELPLPAERMRKSVLDREKAMSTYLGRGLAIPHARLEGVSKPLLIFARSEEGIPVKNREERAHLICILITPAGSPRVQVRLLARICGLLDSSYVAERLKGAPDAAAVLEAIRAGEPIAVR